MTAAAMAVEVVEADLGDPRHAGDLFALLTEFAAHPVAGSVSLGFDDPATLAEKLGEMPTASVWLAYDAGEAAGFAVCFELLSTFSARPYLYVHDLMTSGAYRGKGVARAILDQVEAAARAKGCCKITLEVVEGNEPAKALYARHGFAPATPNPDLGAEQHWYKTLD